MEIAGLNCSNRVRNFFPQFGGEALRYGKAAIGAVLCSQPFGGYAVRQERLGNLGIFGFGVKTLWKDCFSV